MKPNEINDACQGFRRELECMPDPTWIHKFANELGDSLIGSPTRLELIAAAQLHECAESIRRMREMLDTFMGEVPA